MDESYTALSLQTLMRRISDRLDALAGDVHAIEHIIGEELGTGRAQPSTGITRLQRLDFIRQSLEDLALLSHLLSRDSTGTVRSGIAEKLRLDATKTMLDPSPLAVAEPFSSPTIGDVDLF